ncbi:helix-turn-helix domain-containing protein [Clostridium saccharobutylicum]|uniref:Putative transcriptional regulator n=1 Tax=Clostridium saccharobutylicum DSM 13864 TaxID=1345695 RepID=U5MPZ4_CLOSA|nr:helix-turn-helix transcriptional regulator [Clostridium saccharobutylicum]AGX41482.1 putative transcriptional regulator [Clostridium saccharobutylicum DSM 13864]AQR88762.1 HTH-type transcriptional regulator ImmR [Clostridium saccharobutylicum]AQR98660.1 HTH-type transcriptional regulator ImmR [Clostridium saccharobutylicum]AQS12650.1 HTH-type transcriptional regulator ImmR [Clostridium saccharobutylicum]MBA2907818.1 transcriptional regulator with XRE-family HTH domain [Clostridium saccharob
MTLGEKIKFYRNKLNLSQEELAKKCNLSRNAIYNYEKNKRNPTITILITIAKNLNILTTDLLYTNNTEKTSLIELDTINEEKENTNNLELEIAELYNKYFLDLFKWKTINMNPHDYFKFILSLYPLNETNHLTEEDLNELSILFYRFLTLKVHERNALNENKGLNLNLIKCN